MATRTHESSPLCETVIGSMRTASDILAALTLLALDGVRLADYEPVFTIDDNKFTIYKKEDA